MRGLVAAILVLVTVVMTSPASAGDDVPTRYGVAVLAGGAYDPETFGMVLLQGQMVIDYDRVFWHAAPEALRLKLEANGGMTTGDRQRGIVAVDMLALYVLPAYKFGRWLPYVEGGIGVIYTDFQVDGQGSRFNFNPQLGAGFEIPLATGGTMTLGVRLHHLSNGNLLEDNRGVNSVLMQVGYLF